MSTEENKEIVRRYRAAHNANALDQLDGIVASDLKSHNLLPGIPPGLAGAKMVHMGVLASFPDLHTRTDALFAEGDHVVETWTMTMTHTGAPFGGAPASGAKISMPGASVYRIAGGKIVEHSAVQDPSELMQKLGMLRG